MAPQQTVTGDANVLVQIVGENGTVTIGGAAALQLCEYTQPGFTTAPADPGRIGEPGRTPTGRSELRILSPHNRTSLKLEGRDDVCALLQDWLAAPAVLSVQVLIGAGGRGKTRLAAELAAHARANEWTAGFLARAEMDRFSHAAFRSRRDRDTLVVIDYAAARRTDIAAWLRQLVREPEHTAPKKIRLEPPHGPQID